LGYDPEEKEMFLLYRNFMYDVKVEDTGIDNQFIDNLIITYGEKKTTELTTKPVKVNTGTLTQTLNIKKDFGMNKGYAKEHIYQVKYLAALGMIQEIDHEMVLDTKTISPADFVAAAPILPLAKNIRFDLTGATLSSKQWAEIAAKFGGKTDTFDLWHAKIDKESETPLSKICSTLKYLRLLDNEFEEFKVFLAKVEKNLKPGMVKSNDDKTGTDEKRFLMCWKSKTSCKKFRPDIIGMAKRLGWKIITDEVADLEDSDNEAEENKPFSYKPTKVYPNQMEISNYTTKWDD